MITYRWIHDSGAYNVELINRWGDESNDKLKCEIDDCIQMGIVLVTSEFAGNYSTVACYPHLQFALEDVLWNMRNNTKKGIKHSLRELKDKIDEERKLGFEYN